MIDEKTTEIRFGYTSNTLSRGSGKKVVRKCDKCGDLKDVEFKSIRDLSQILCQKCAQLKRYDNPKEHEIMSRIILKIHKNNPEIDRQISESHKKRHEESDGNPIEMHHIIYDENDNDRFRIPLRMTAHHKIHDAFKRSGFKTPHINRRGSL